MSPSLSVIIPTLDEERHVGAAIDSAFRAGAFEVIVADGGSNDRTCEVARAHGAQILACAQMRAKQLNAGAAEARGEQLLFLHADTLLPDGTAVAVAKELEGGFGFGGFRVSFAEPALRLRVAAAMINLRTSITGCPWGDQAQFIRRELFREVGGYREIALMEDYDLAVRMKRRGRNALLPLKVVTSGRRFLRRGVLRTATTNWRIIAAYRAGADPEELARIYRG